MSEASSFNAVSADAPADVSLSEHTNVNQDQRVDPAEFRKQLEEIRRAEENQESEQAPEPEEDRVEEQEEPERVQEESSHDDDVDEYEGKTIPKKRLNKEIEKRKNLEGELQRERDERIKLKTELDLYNQAIQKLNTKSTQQQQQEDAIDPIDERAHNLYMREIQELKAQLNQQKRQSDEVAQSSYFEKTVNSQQAQFAAEHPDFDKAYKHLIDSEIQNAKLVVENEGQAIAAAQTRLYSMAQAALERGQSVPDLFYKMSKNYGYSAEQKAAVSKKGPDLGKIETNMRASASPSGEVRGAPNLKISESVSQYTSLDNFDQLMDRQGKGVDASAFHSVLAKLREGR